MASFVNWVYGQPDKARTAECVTIIPGGQWNNVNCYNRFPFVCEKGMFVHFFIILPALQKARL